MRAATRQGPSRLNRLVNPFPVASPVHRPAGSAPGGTHPPGVRVVTDRGDLRALAAAAAEGVATIRVSWAGVDEFLAGPPPASAVVLGADAVARVALLGRSRTPVVVVAAPADLTEVWPCALAVGADDVIVPGVRGDLSAWLRALGPAGSPRGAVTVVGGRGGAGATTAAVALSRAMAVARGACVLLDADPWGGGIDLALGAEAVPGARWPDVADLVGPDAVRWLVPALPLVDGVSVLSHGRPGHAGRPGPPAPLSDTVAGVLDACLASGRPVVIDLARRPDAVAAAVLARTRTLVVVVPAEVRACAAAACVVDTVAQAVTDVRLLVRGPSPAGLEAEDVAAAVGVPAFAEVRPEPGLAAALDRGDQVAGSGRSPLRRWASALVDSLQPWDRDE